MPWDNERKIWVRTLDVVTLLYNCLEASRLNDIGYQDAELFLSDILLELDKSGLRVNQKALESVLWSCNMMSEVGLFWDTKNRNFDTFIKELLARKHKPKYTFNKDYNWIERKETKKND